MRKWFKIIVVNYPLIFQPKLLMHFWESSSSVINIFVDVGEAYLKRSFPKYFNNLSWNI